MPTRRYPWATHGQMTLGALADALAALPTTKPIPSLIRPHSARASYSHIAFEEGPPAPASDVAAAVRWEIGADHEGWKGGTYRMAADTPVHIAQRGEPGRAIMGLDAEGRVILAPEEPDNAGWDDDLPDTSGIDADSIRRTAAALTPADADEVKRREIITLTPAQIEALGRYYSDPSPVVVATYAEAVLLCLPPLVAGTRHFETCDPLNGIHAYPTQEGGAVLSADCTLAQALRAREAAQWLLGRVETHTECPQSP